MTEKKEKNKVFLTYSKPKTCIPKYLKGGGEMRDKERTK